MIRRALEIDYPSIYELGNKLILNYRKLYNLTNIIDNQIHFINVCVVDNKIVGFIQYTLSIDEVDVVGLIVLNDYVRKGIGSRLMYSIINEPYVKKINVEVREDNDRAIKFYEKLGFVKIRVIKKYYGNKDAIFMVKLIEKENNK